MWWANLPPDILRAIMKSDLFLKERVVMSSVCKDWNETFLQMQHNNSMEEQFHPWIIDDIRDSWKLKQPQTNACIIKDDHPFQQFKSLVAVKFGWTLCESLVDILSASKHLSSIQYTLYDPFTDQFIKTPILIKNWYSYTLCTFTDNPNSPSCILVDFQLESKELWIQTCRPKDKSWKVFKYGIEANSIEQAACIGDFVYCTYEYEYKEETNEEGEWYRSIGMGAFNVKNGSWRVFPYLVMPEYLSYSLVVAFNGVLYVVTFWGDEDYKFWRFDFCKEKWMLCKPEEIKKHMFFISSASCFSVPAARGLEEYGGTVHILSFDQVWIQPSFQRIWRW